MRILALLMAAARLFNTAAIAQDVVFLESANALDGYVALTASTATLGKKSSGTEKLDGRIISSAQRPQRHSLRQLRVRRQARRIQERISGVSYAPRKRNLNEDFPLRGHVTCADCGTPLTAYWAHKVLQPPLLPVPEEGLRQLWQIDPPRCHRG